MEPVIALIVTIVILKITYNLYKNTTLPTDSDTPSPVPLDESDHVLAAHMEILHQRAEAARTNPSSLPHWYADKPTQSQLERLECLGFTYDFTAEIETKGYASDLISMLSEPSGDTLKELKLYADTHPAVSELDAREQIRTKSQSSGNTTLLPAHHLFFAYFGRTPPNDYNALQVEQFIESILCSEDSVDELWGDILFLWESIVELRDIKFSELKHSPTPLEFAAAIKSCENKQPIDINSEFEREIVSYLNKNSE